MQTTRAIAGRVLVAPSSLSRIGIPNIAGKEMMVAHIYDPRSGHSRMQLSAFPVKNDGMWGANNMRPDRLGRPR